MSKKLRCKITGKVIYMTEQRYAKLVSKYGSEEKLNDQYVSHVGKKVQEGSMEHTDEFKNRIKCSVTGLSCYISNERIEAGIKKYGSWNAFEDQYISRDAAKLLRLRMSRPTIKALADTNKLTETLALVGLSEELDHHQETHDTTLASV